MRNKHRTFLHQRSR